MRVLIADDNLVSRHLLERILVRWGYEVITACDGIEAFDLLQRTSAPPLVILDWMMPGMDGIEVCRKLRNNQLSQPPYIILLTVKGNKDDIVLGLEAGANDYVTKPFEPEELRARIRVGERVLSLQLELADKVADLQRALSQVKQLTGLIPICSYCKRVRDDQNYWHQVEQYIAEHSEATFTHGMCPECSEKFLNSVKIMTRVETS